MVRHVLRSILIEILTEYGACIAHEINDRAYSQYSIPFTSFRDLREVRDELISEGIVREVARDSPYGRPYKFHYLSTNSSRVDRVIEKKHSMLLEYSHHTREIGRFGEDLVANAVSKLGFTDVKVRKPLGKKDIDVWCRGPSEKFYWAIECKNRRQEIDENDVSDVCDKAKKASSKWGVNSVKPALVSSSVYCRLPKETGFPIIPTGSIYVPNDRLYSQYKISLGSWYIKPVNSAPNELVELIDKLPK